MKNSQVLFLRVTKIWNLSIGKMAKLILDFR